MSDWIVVAKDRAGVAFMAARKPNIAEADRLAELWMQGDDVSAVSCREVAAERAVFRRRFR